MLMRLRFHVLLIVLVASLALNAGVGATFGVRALSGHRPDDREPRPHRDHSLVKLLNLSPEEADRVRAQEAKLSDDIDAIHEQLRPEQEELTALMTAPVPDRDAIRTKLDDIGALRHEMTVRLVEHLLDVRATLDPARREKLDEFIKHRFERRGPGDRGRWRDRHGDGRRGGPHRMGRGPDAGAMIDRDAQRNSECRVPADERS